MLENSLTTFACTLNQPLLRVCESFLWPIVLHLLGLSTQLVSFSTLICQPPNMLHHCQRQAKSVGEVYQEEGIIHQAMSEHVGHGGHEAEAEVRQG